MNNLKTFDRKKKINDELMADESSFGSLMLFFILFAFFIAKTSFFISLRIKGIPQLYIKKLFAISKWFLKKKYTHIEENMQINKR